MPKVAKNFIYMLFANVFSRIIGLILTIYMARKFGPTDFGVINFSSVFIGYFSMLASMGIQSFGIVQVIKDKNNLKKNVDIIVSLRIVLSLLAFIVLIIVTFLINVDLNVKKMIVISGFSILINSLCLDWVFNALQEMKYISYSVMMTSVLSILLVFIPIYTHIYTEIYIVPIVSIIASIISNLYLATIYRKKLKNTVNFKIDTKQFLKLLQNSWPFFFSGVFATINTNFDSLMLGFMRSNYDVGLYNSVYKLINVLTLFVSFIFIPLFPILIEYFNEKKYDDLGIIINNVRKILIIFAIPMLIVAFTLSKETLFTLYGAKYMGASTVFTILISFVAIFSIRELYGYELTAWGLQKQYMKIVLLSSSINIISNAILIPKYGINGAALCTLFSEVINITLMYKLSRKTLNVKYDNGYIFRIIASAIIMSISIYLVKMTSSNIFLIAIIAGIIYLVSIFILKVITIKEVKLLFGGQK